MGSQENTMSSQSRGRLNVPHQFVSDGARFSLRQRLALTFALWRQRTTTRRLLAQMDARSLRDAGISPAAAAYESGKPFWRKMGDLR
jgi:uncharacterized protein YjiS (DUF1127 family)